MQENAFLAQNVRRWCFRVLDFEVYGFWHAPMARTTLRCIGQHTTDAGMHVDDLSSGQADSAMRVKLMRASVCIVEDPVKLTRGFEEN
eukprot:3322222-Rhodomonas_salina.1